MLVYIKYCFSNFNDSGVGIFFFFWLQRVLVAARGILALGLLLSFGVWVFSLSLWRAGSMPRGLCSLRHVGSVVEARGLSCPTACGILVPRPRIKPASPALEGGFFTTGPPGKSPHEEILIRVALRHTLRILP